MFSNRLQSLALVTLAALVLSPRPAEAQKRYTFTEIGPLPGGLRSTATNINASGQIAGVSYGDALFGGNWPPMPDTALGYVWSKGVSIPLLPPAGYQGTWAYGGGRAINDHGQVAGHAAMVDASIPSPPDWLGHPLLVGNVPVVWDKDGTVRTLAVPAGFVSTTIAAINNRGQVVGYASVSLGAFDPGPWGEWWMIPARGSAVLWNNAESPILLPTLPGFEGGATTASSINDSGQIVGFAATADGSLTHAVLWDKGRVIDLTPTEMVYSEADGINNRGQVVVNGSFGAGVWSNGTISPLPSIPGDLWNFALSINDKGQVVGFSSGTDGDPNGRGVLWENGNIYNIMTLVDGFPDDRHLGWAYSINNKGQIVGFGSRKDAHGVLQNVGFLLTPKK